MMILEGPKRVKDITGIDAENRHGDALGTIHDLMVGTDGCVKYAILAYGGFMGLGEKLIVVPWRLVKFWTDKAIIDVTKNNLDAAPHFEADSWPTMSNEDWAASVDEYYKSLTYDVEGQDVVTHSTEGRQPIVKEDGEFSVQQDVMQHGRGMVTDTSEHPQNVH